MAKKASDKSWLKSEIEQPKGEGEVVCEGWSGAQAFRGAAERNGVVWSG